MNKFFKRSAVILFCFGTAVLLSCRQTAADEVCHERQCVTVDIARTPESQQRGLMFVPSLPAEKGMLFIFPQSAEHRIWMKNTLIPLDIIWMDSARRIVHIERNVPPCPKETVSCPSYGPQFEALYVLEVNAGIASQWGLSPGNTLEFRLKDFE